MVFSEGIYPMTAYAWTLIGHLPTVFVVYLTSRANNKLESNLGNQKVHLPHYIYVYMSTLTLGLGCSEVEASFET